MNNKPNKLASELVTCMKSLAELGLNPGRAGNASVRVDAERFLITPSGVHPRDLTDYQVVTLSLADEHAPADSIPSSEWRMHRDVLVADKSIKAVVHTHSNAATAVACLGLPIPAFHYMIAVAGGDSIECAPYATFGSHLLSGHVVSALTGRRACLMENHGLIATGSTIQDAVDLALEVEQLASQYLMCLNAGKPTILDKQEMKKVIEKFKHYGKRTG